MTVGLSVATIHGNFQNFVWLPWQPLKSHTLISWGPSGGGGGGGCGFISSRTQYNAACMTNMTNRRMVIDIVM